MSEQKSDDGFATRSSHMDGWAPQHASLRETQKQLTRERLITAGLAQFREIGYNQTTADAIAKAAGASRATLYVYFKSKAEIVIEIMRRIEPEVLRAYSDLDSIRDPDLKSIEAWLATTMEQWRDHRLEYAAMEQALASDDAVTDVWYGLLQTTWQHMPNLFNSLTDPADREAAKLHLLTLQMALDRTLYFAIVRERPIDLECLRTVAATQWLDFLHRGRAASATGTTPRAEKEYS
ncbi:hypothetical protein GCM10022381_28110 [Leifsonia kafniensis]|uniref:HTH tetR-type domain-containing protein n=1 Tax=Leifsonia kafniensis TaxID=475957 RepID=A0ABP7KRM1_9MICO